MKIKLLKAQITNKCFLEEDEKILKLSFNLENDEKLNNEEIVTFDEKKNYKLVKALKNILLILSSFKIDIDITFHIQLLRRMNDQHLESLVVHE